MIEYESLDGEQVAKIVKNGSVDHLGKNKPGDGPTGAEATTPTADEAPDKTPPKEDPGLGTGSPAPAPA